MNIVLILEEKKNNNYKTILLELTKTTWKKNLLEYYYNENQKQVITKNDVFIKQYHWVDAEIPQYVEHMKQIGFKIIRYEE